MSPERASPRHVSPKQVSGDQGAAAGGVLRILMFGRTGQVAREMIARSGVVGAVVTPLGREEVDLDDLDAVAAAVRCADGVDVVVNAAAYTAVDRAETEEALVHRINADAPRAMAQACAVRGLPLVHISTDGVFDGSKDGAYGEDDATGPLNAYGRSKLAGERGVQDALASHVIVRTSWVFAPHGRNFARTVMRLARDVEELRIIDDQRGRPTVAAHLADAVLTVAAAAQRGEDQRGASPWGVFHYADTGVLTWAAFAREILEMLDAGGARTPPLRTITTQEYGAPARRPANFTLATDRIENAFGIIPRDWRPALRLMVTAELARSEGEEA